MPTYNSEAFVEESIESIQKQSYQQWELLITDDASTDKTVSLIRKMQIKDSRIKLFELTENKGSGIARNKSIKNAKGRFISFCDSDDKWYVNKLQIQIDFMKTNKLSFTYSGYDIIDENNNLISYFLPSETLTYNCLLKSNDIGCLTAIYDTKTLGKLYMPKIRNRQDWVLWLLILKKIKKTIGITEKLGSYRIRKDSISRNKIKMVKYHWKVYNEELGYSKVSSIILLLRYLWFYIINKK